MIDPPRRKCRRPWGRAGRQVSVKVTNPVKKIKMVAGMKVEPVKKWENFVYI